MKRERCAVLTVASAWFNLTPRARRRCASRPSWETTNLSSCCGLAWGDEEGALGRTRLLGTQLHRVLQVHKSDSPRAVPVSSQHNHVCLEHAKVHSRPSQLSDFARLGILRGSLHDNASLISSRQSAPRTPSATDTILWLRTPTPGISRLMLRCIANGYMNHDQSVWRFIRKRG